MLDLQYILDNRDAVAQNCEDRGVTVDLDRLVEASSSKPYLSYQKAGSYGLIIY